MTLILQGLIKERQVRASLLQGFLGQLIQVELKGLRDHILLLLMLPRSGRIHTYPSPHPKGSDLPIFRVCSRGRRKFESQINRLKSYFLDNRINRENGTFGMEAKTPIQSSHGL